MTKIMALTVSAGHYEYGASLSELAETVWNPHDEDIWEQDDTEVAANSLYQARNLPQIDADPTWEIVIRLLGTEDELNAGLDGLLAELAGGPQGGDDDTYDYWPSGVRLAQAIALRLGRWADVEEMIGNALLDPSMREEMSI